MFQYVVHFDLKRVDTFFTNDLIKNGFSKIISERHTPRFLRRDIDGHRNNRPGLDEAIG
jgi:hypothetical protein